MSLGSNLRSIRKERKLTQEAVAYEIGVSFQAVSSWERDEYMPDTENLIRLAELYGVTVSSLVEKKKHMFKDQQRIFCVWEYQIRRILCV